MASSDGSRSSSDARCASHAPRALVWGHGQNAVDDFLFEAKRGFCEHYAGSFTVLMRAVADGVLE